MNEERITRLANFLVDAVPEKHFSLSTWRSGRCKEDEDLLKHTCGTTGCAVGWAVVLPDFKEAGLTSIAGFPMFQGVAGWEAVQRFFGLSYEEAVALFSCDTYAGDVGPIDVADRMLWFINDKVTVMQDAKEWERENRISAGWHGEPDEEDPEDS